MEYNWNYIMFSHIVKEMGRILSNYFVEQLQKEEWYSD